MYTHGFIHNKFLLFVMLIAIAVVVTPWFKNAFSDTAHDQLEAQMKQTSAILFDYIQDEGTARYACISDKIGDVIDELYLNHDSSFVTCEVSFDDEKIILYTQRNDDLYVCADSSPEFSYLINEPIGDTCL